MMKLARVYGKHFLRFEAGIALLLTALFFGWTARFGGWAYVENILSGNRGAVYGALSSIFGSLLGFVIAAVAIVLGYAESERLTILRKSQNWSTLWQVFTASMRALGFATAVCLLALILDRDNSPVHLVVHFCVFGILLALARLCRALWVLESIIKIATRPESSTPITHAPH